MMLLTLAAVTCSQDTVIDSEQHLMFAQQLPVKHYNTHEPLLQPIIGKAFTDQLGCIIIITKLSVFMDSAY